mmetsp:Transcript_2271/g.3363  ORF Transcript_2271/g.3363 Transcript_2271/m.3363 type:complete len:84 (-) Transcript_2271:231-482(-)
MPLKFLPRYICRISNFSSIVDATNEKTINSAPLVPPPPVSFASMPALTSHETYVLKYGSEDTNPESEDLHEQSWVQSARHLVK